MALGKKYTGGFPSRDGSYYDVEIWVENPGTQNPVNLIFPYAEPLTIEWPVQDKIEPVRGSAATLVVEAQSDGQFISLDCVEAGTVRLDVYRTVNHVRTLYWSGMMDPESYEEPYDRTSQYDVALTFTDFGILERKKCTLTGIQAVDDIISACIAVSEIQYRGIRVYSGTTWDSQSAVETLKVNTEVFEDKGFKEVLKGVLLPFALQVVQKDGYINIYDIHSLYQQNPLPISWSSSGQTYSKDVVYNNVNVAFDPADDSTLVEGIVETDESLGTDSGLLFRTGYHKTSGQADDPEGFKLHKRNAGDTDTNITVLNGNAKYFQITPIFSGNEDTGVFWGVRKGESGCGNPGPGDTNLDGMAPFNALTGNTGGTGTVNNIQTLMALPRRLVNYTSWDRLKYRLKIVLPVLFDVRYNPFEQAAENNEDGNWKWMQKYINLAYVPVRLILYDSPTNGTALYHYENKVTLASADYRDHGRWAAGAGSWGDAWLAYYDWDDRKDKSGCGGWADNKPMIGKYGKELPEMWKKRGVGDYITLPPVGGYLELQIGTGVHQYNFDDGEVHDVYSYIRWLMYKAPSIYVTDSNGKESEGGAIEDQAYINVSASEELSVDTFIGTVPDRLGYPTAKGALLDNNLTCVAQCTRAGRTERLEHLLICTICSQYATRKTKLSGQIELVPQFGPMGEMTRPGKYMIVGEVQDLAAGESDATMVEIAPDEYDYETV